VKLGEPMPGILLVEPGGKEVRVPGDLGARLTALILWSEGCSFCKREMPGMEKVYRDLKDRGFLVAGVHLGDAEKTVSEMRDLNNITFPMLIDRNEVFKKKYGIRYVPMVIMFDSGHLVVEKILGGVNAEDLKRLAMEHLG
jgi:peroxiredoxin